MGLLHLLPIRRRRHGSYDIPEGSRRQTTISYTIPSEKGSFVQVCKKNFMNTFSVTRKKLDVLIAKKKAGNNFYFDKRTSHKSPNLQKMIVKR